MSKKCEVCGKGPQFGNKISHAHNVSKRRWNPNIQNIRVSVNGGAKRMKVCTNCIKTGSVKKHINIKVKV